MHRLQRLRQITAAVTFGPILALGLATSLGAQLRGNPDQYWHAAVPGMDGDDSVIFGEAVVSGDFNGDGYYDLAIGSESASVYDVGAGVVTAFAGDVHVLYGGPSGLGMGKHQRWTKLQLGSTPGLNDRFGAVLACGNFNGDQYDDLAIAVPDDDDSGANEAGGVHILHGGAGGLADSGQFWHQGVAGVSGDLEAGERFGRAMAVGNFDGDLYEDLAVTTRFNDPGSDSFGSVSILRGGPGGLSADGNQLFTLDDTVVGNEPGDDFGRVLAAGNFNGDPYDDLVISTTERNVLGQTNAGAVTVLYGDLGGLTTTDSQWIHQGLVAISDVAEPFDSFGASLAVGNFDGDAYDDLVIGVMQEDLSGKLQNGAAHLLYGSGVGLDLLDDEFLHQNVANFPDKIESYDRFAAAFAVADFDADGLDDLAVGVSGEDYLALSVSRVEPDATPDDLDLVPRGDPILGPGTVNILFGTGSGLLPEAAKPPVIWKQTSEGVNGTAASNNLFGAKLAAGDFNGDGRADLAIQSQEEEVQDAGMTVALGSIVVLTSDIFSDGFESGDTTAWSLTTP